MRVVLMPTWLSRDLAIGFFVGTFVMAALWYLTTERNIMTPNEAAFYDHCLVGHNGNKTACDAMMRIVKKN